MRLLCMNCLQAKKSAIQYSRRDFYWQADFVFSANPADSGLFLSFRNKKRPADVAPGAHEGYA